MCFRRTYEDILPVTIATKSIFMLNSESISLHGQTLSFENQLKTSKPETYFEMYNIYSEIYSLFFFNKELIKVRHANAL